MSPLLLKMLLGLHLSLALSSLQSSLLFLGVADSLGKKDDVRDIVLVPFIVVCWFCVFMQVIKYLSKVNKPGRCQFKVTNQFKDKDNRHKVSSRFRSKDSKFKVTNNQLKVTNNQFKVTSSQFKVTNNSQFILSNDKVWLRNHQFKVNKNQEMLNKNSRVSIFDICV